MFLTITTLTVASAFFTPGLDAQAPPTRDSLPVYSLEPLTVEGRADDLTGLANSASIGFVGARDLRVRPIARVGELLEVVPGMILTQHSGSGKSNQMFVRGFNLDHGTDFSTRVEGMPVNLPTHAHGQGYTDLNFIIPELVDAIEYSLGTYYADIGDFGSAGGAEVRMRRRLEAPLFDLSAGAFGHRRVVGATSFDVGERTSLLAGVEAQRYDGPWDVPEGVHKTNGMVRLEHTTRSQTLSVLVMGYDNEWSASDQIPSRAVSAGTIDRFGQVDPTLGGASSRYSLSAGWTRSSPTGSQHADVYAIRYGLDLFSNFTYLLDDPVSGDQIRQVDDGRLIWGANLGTLLPLGGAGLDHELSLGSQIRGDRADLALSRTNARARVSTVRSDVVDQMSVGLFGEWTARWSPVLRSVVGLRWDGYAFDVAADRVANSGDATDGIVSPKLSLAWLAAPSVELYASGGLGFHSNDARGVLTTLDPIDEVTVEPVDPLVPSWGTEIGTRLSPRPGWNATVTAWAIGLESELVYVGDAGRVEASDGSLRTGVSITNFYRFHPDWTADADLSVTRARFQDVAVGEDRIPGALERVVAMGVVREPAEGGVFGSIRLRHFGAYPLNETGDVRAEPNSMVNAKVGLAVGAVRVAITLLNVLDEQNSDIQYLYESRLSGEPLAGVEDVHFHPAEPRRLQMSLSWGIGS